MILWRYSLLNVVFKNVNSGRSKWLEDGCHLQPAQSLLLIPCHLTCSFSSFFTVKDASLMRVEKRRPKAAISRGGLRSSEMYTMWGIWWRWWRNLQSSMTHISSLHRWCKLSIQEAYKWCLEDQVMGESKCHYSEAVNTGQETLLGWLLIIYVSISNICALCLLCQDWVPIINKVCIASHGLIPADQYLLVSQKIISLHQEFSNIPILQMFLM